MRYLNPKADLTFKKVFGEHKDVIISFLNALLPLEEDGQVTSVEYLTPELVPHTPMNKDSIVDVRCQDQQGRQFIVEMQMMWTSEYKKRVLFNASKAYVRQLETGGDYTQLQTVYSLNLVNDTYSESDRYYHHYRIVEDADTQEVIEGLQFVFIELPKFTPRNYGDKRMQVLWLRYLTEIDEKTLTIPEELTHVPEIQKAVNQIEESAFTPGQLLAYEKFWDVVSTAKTTISSAFKDGEKKGIKKGMKKGLEKGRKEGLEKGRQEGLEKGRKEGLEKGRKEGQKEERLKIARNLQAMGMTPQQIADVTGLSPEDIDA